MDSPLDPIMRLVEKALTRPIPVHRWGTVTAVGPLRVQLDGDTDPLPFTPQNAAGALTVGARVWCVEQHRRVTILTGGSDTGWVTLAREPGIDGTVKYRQVGGTVEVYVDVTGTFPTTDFLISTALPAAARPAEGVHTGASWLDPSGQGVGYVTSAGNVRHGRGSVASSRIRFTVSFISGS